jgi:hypothetical protein
MLPSRGYDSGDVRACGEEFLLLRKYGHGGKLFDKRMQSLHAPAGRNCIRGRCERNDVWE